MLALVASIHALDTAFDERSEDVDGRDKPDHDGSARPTDLGAASRETVPKLTKASV
jgi:hypothetical protein